MDSSLFNAGTTIPTWACNMWGIQEIFSGCRSKKDDNSIVTIEFNGIEYQGNVTIAPMGRKTPAYRLWYSEELQSVIKDIFLMSFMRDIEARLRQEKSNIEEEIAFWEFLDIEFDRNKKRFYYTAYYIQKPSFPELFKRLVGSPVLHKIDDELAGKGELRIYKQDWKKREDLETELGAENVLYMLADTKNKLLYIGEGSNLIKRLRQEHPSISHWDYYRYNVLPKQFAGYRLILERMLIRDFASLLDNKKDVETISISDYKLANDKIDK